MKPLNVLLLGFIVLPLWANTKVQEVKKDNHSHQQDHHESSFEVIPLNSPLTGATAKFLVKTPKGFDINKFKYVVKSGNKVYEKEKLPSPVKLIEGPQGKELHFKASQLPPGTYEIYVKVVDKYNREKHCKNQQKDHATFVVSDLLEVADPGEEGMKTLQGIAGPDGIRDDLQRWIAENYQNQDQKNSLKQYAKEYQRMLVENNDKLKSVSNMIALFRATNCTRYTSGSNSSYETRKEVKARMLNTRDRLIAFSKVNEHFRGQAYFSKDRSPADCDFQVINKG